MEFNEGVQHKLIELNKSDHKVEFLVSTMYRSDIDFLESIFKHFELKALQVLVINQTTQDKQLYTEQPNIRVINSFKKGLSKSRNLALEHAKGSICFISDDDVEYLPEAIETLTQAYQDYPKAALISFQFLSKNGKIETLYQEEAGVQNGLLHKQHLHSIEMTLRPEVLLREGIRFNTCFGIGALFHSGEEEVLRNDLIRKAHEVVYINKPIVKHLGKPTVANEGSREFTRAIIAVKYRLHKNLIYLWLLRYIWLLLKRKAIRFSQTKHIWTYGVNAVSDYKRYCKQ